MKLERVEIPYKLVVSPRSKILDHMWEIRRKLALAHTQLDCARQSVEYCEEQIYSLHEAYAEAAASLEVW